MSGAGKRWHAATQQFLPADHPLMAEQAAAKAAKDQAGRQYIVDMLRATEEQMRRRSAEILAWELKHDRDWKGPR